MFFRVKVSLFITSTSTQYFPSCSNLGTLENLQIMQLLSAWHCTLAKYYISYYCKIIDALKSTISTASLNQGLPEHRN